MTDDLAARVAAIEEQVAKLVAARTRDAATGTDQDASTSTGEPGPADQPGGRFWVLDGLKRRHPQGAVLYAGAVDLPTGEHYEWQWGRLPQDVLADDWSELAGSLTALAHPVRLRLLHRVLHGARSTADLADDPELGTTGQLYHHLRQLVSAGWLESAARGRYGVPAARVVPLLVIMMGAQK